MSGSLSEVFRTALKLGLTSFGGPVAHLGYFREEYVVRRKWLSEGAYADLVALCQFLPGPASSQVGIGIGLHRAGWFGAVLAWIGFTLPSALALALFAAVSQYLHPETNGWLHGLKLVAVIIVAQAVWGMRKTLSPDPPRATIAVAAAAAVIAFPEAWTQFAALIAGGLAGILLFRRAESNVGPAAPELRTLSRGAAVACLVVFMLLLALLPIAARAIDHPGAAVADSFYRVGSLVFGGGHVVLPMLEAEVVGDGWVGTDVFLAGYGAAQAVPGPLFAFAAYIGAAMGGSPSVGAVYAALALATVFVPSFLLVFGVLPFWSRLRSSVYARSALAGVNAAVVGLLFAALYDPIFTRSVTRAEDMIIVLIGAALLFVWRLPPWLVVAGTASASGIIYMFV